MAEGSITHWIMRLRSERDIATETLYRRFRRRVVLFARQLLATTGRSIRDEEDIAQEAFTDFYQGIDAGRFPRISNRDELWSILASITYRRAADYRRWLRVRDARSDPADAGHSYSLSVDASHALPDPNATGEELVEMSDLLDELFRRLEDPKLQETVLLKLEGYTNDEIARLSQCSVRTVERRLYVVRQRWVGMWSDPLPASRNTVAGCAREQSIDDERR